MSITFMQKVLKSKYPIVGLLAADDERNSYFLSNSENECLNPQGVLHCNGLTIFKTTQRFDKISPRTVFGLFKHRYGGGGGGLLCLSMNTFFIV